MATAAQAQGDSSPLPGKDKSVKFYPNPATTQITFDLQGNYQPGLSIAIYSFLGKKMLETRPVSDKTNIPLSNFNRGMYIFYLTDSKGKVIENGKFQVSN